MLGMMIQLDGSPHDWFEGEAGLTGCGSEGSKEDNNSNSYAIKYA